MNESNLAGPDLGLRVVHYEPGQVMGLHQHEKPTIGIIVGGMVAETAEGKTVVQRTGALVRKPSGLLHRNEFGPSGAVMLSIRNFDPEIPSIPWSWLHHSNIARQAIGIVGELAAGDDFGAAEERAWRLLAIIYTQDAGSSARMPPVWLCRIRDQVANAIARPSVSQLARSAGLHPVYLTRLFNNHYGCSISAFFRTTRIQRATDSLLRPSKTMAAVAAEHGFSDQSHFCRAFRSEVGLSPSAYRALLLRFAS